MKKLILTILFCLFTTACFADHWVYIRLEDRPGVTTDDDKGRSKSGDIVQIVPVVEKEVPTETAQKEWAIVRVTGLKENDISLYTIPWRENDGLDYEGHVKYIQKAYRRYQLKEKWVEKLKKGIFPRIVNITELVTNLEIKTALTIARYERKRKFYAYVQRPLLIVRNKIVRPAFAETVSKVCAVGDNCSDENYNTLTAWEDAKDGDLETDTRQETAEVYDDDGTITDTIQIDGSTTTAAYYMKITVPSAERHDGTEYGGTGAKIYSGNSYYDIIRVDDSYTVVEWLIMESNLKGGPDFSTFGGRVNNNIITCNTHCWSAKGIFADGSTNIYNNIIYGSCDDGIFVYCQYNDFNVYNNTIYSADGDGIQIDYAKGTCNAINNLVIGSSGTADYHTANSGAWDTFTTNGSGDASGSAGLQSLTTSEWESVTGGSEDLHLAASSSSEDAGTDNGDGVWDTDIDGRDRDTEGDTWDLGADEYVAAVSAARRIFTAM